MINYLPSIVINKVSNKNSNLLMYIKFLNGVVDYVTSTNYLWPIKVRGKRLMRFIKKTRDPWSIKQQIPVKTGHEDCVVWGV